MASIRFWKKNIPFEFRTLLFTITLGCNKPISNKNNCNQ